MPTTLTQPFTITVTITPSLSAIMLSNTEFSGPADNAGQMIGSINVITNPPGGDVSNVELSLTGADADKFALSSMSLPADLMFGEMNVPAGAYEISISADTP